jgi:putative tryptophan/tyrosine transport system substrate-binding protein
MPMLPDRRRTRVLLVALAALGGAVILVVSLTAWASTNGGSSSAQSVPRVGLMHVGTDHVPSSWPALKARLAELIWRNLEPDAAPAQARMFVSQHVDAIVAFEDTSIAAAQAATARSHTPIVFLHPSDPVRDGLVKSLSHPGTNLTGVYGARDEVDKQLEIYQLLVPQLRRMLTLVDPTDKRTKRLLPGFRAAAAQLARPIRLDIREASSAQDLKRVFRSLKPGEVDGVFLLSPSLRLNHTALTIRLAKQARLPVQAHRKEWVEQGALFSYGIDLPLIGRTGARYVDSILRGTSPADLPVEEVPKLEFAINLQTAGKLGFKVPQNMIIRADKVYR